MTLETAYADGQWAAMRYYKVAWPTPSNPTVANSAVLGNNEPKQTGLGGLTPPTTPFQLSQIFDAHEQGKTRTEPRRKLSADICTTCRKAKHYGPCNAPKPIPKAANFNAGMMGDDPNVSNDSGTSPHYHSATTADSSLARSRDTQPADIQAQTAFADLFRANGGGINGVADQSVQSYGGLNKTAKRKLADFMLPSISGHSMHEQRGPSVNPYEERKTVMSPPVGWGPDGDQRIDQAFGQIDCATDSTNIEDASKGAPSGGPAVLG